MNPITTIRGAFGRLLAAPQAGLTSMEPAVVELRDGRAPAGVARGAVGSLRSDTAIDQFATLLTRLPDPDDVLKRAGLKRHDLRRLEFDDEISSAIETRREACVMSAWRLESPDGEPKKFVEAELKRAIEPALRGMWEAVPYGYSVCEAVYAPREGGRYGIGRVGVKPMQWFDPQRDGRLLMQLPGSAIRVEVDQRLKFHLMRRNGTYQNPYGEALLSRLYWAWFFRHTGAKAWMQFLERFGDPFVVANGGQPEELTNALLRMGLRNVIGVGTDDTVAVLQQASAGEFERLEDALGRRIQKVILGQTLTSQVGDKGSYAAAKVHDNVRQDKRQSDLRMLAGGCQWVVNALWEVNSFPGDPPQFVFADSAGIEMDRAERDSKIAGTGQVRFTEEYLLRAYDYEEGDLVIVDPEPGTEDANEPATKPRGNPAAKMPKNTPGKKKQLAQGDRKRFTPEQEAVERLVEDAMALAPGGPLSVRDLQAAIRGARDQDELEERLALLLDKQSPGFQEVMARAIFAADVLGYVHADEESA